MALGVEINHMIPKIEIASITFEDQLHIRRTI